MMTINLYKYIHLYDNAPVRNACFDELSNTLLYVWPIHFLINVITALEGSQFYFYSVLIQLSSEIK